MQTRFHFDPRLVKGTTIIFGVLFLLMAALSLLSGPSTRPVLFLAVTGALLLLFWIGFLRGSYITVDDKNVFGRVFFIRGRTTSIADIVSIHRRGTFGGAMAELYMMVRGKNGMVTERGLVGKPGLTESDLKKLLDIIRSKNPMIEIGQDVFRK